MNYGRFLSTESYSSSDKNDGFIVSQSRNKALKKGCFKMYPWVNWFTNAPCIRKQKPVAGILSTCACILKQPFSVCHKQQSKKKETVLSNYLHGKKKFFTWKEKFIFMKKRISFHVNNWQQAVCDFRHIYKEKDRQPIKPMDCLPFLPFSNTVEKATLPFRYHFSL